MTNPRINAGVSEKPAIVGALAHHQKFLPDNSEIK